MVANGLHERKKRAAVAKWKASGLSQAEFCRREGLEQWQLSEWKRFVEVLESQSEAVPANGGEGAASVYPGKRARKQNRHGAGRAKRAKRAAVAPKAEQSFVPVELVGMAEEDAKGGAATGGSELDCVLEVVLRDGQIVRVGSDCHPQLLGAVLAILRT
jgi:hypothetical protein